MATNQGVFTFLNITGELSASTTFTKGINPSVTTVTITPPVYQQLLASGQHTGTAYWYYDGVEVRRMPRSTIDSAQSTDQDGLVSYQVAILDRRWEWQFGQITGEYNIPRPGLSGVVRSRTPRQLAELCLIAMGETSYDVSQLPNDDTPYVFWEVANPAKALAEIADMGACDVVLRNDNSVALVRRGQGKFLPPIGTGTNNARLSYQQVMNRKELPPSFAIVSSPTRWQVDMRLQPVGYEDQDSEPIPIVNLSYAPIGQPYVNEDGSVEFAPNGWHWIGPDSNFEWITDETKRSLAKKHIFRTFRVNIVGHLTDPVPSLPLPNSYVPPPNERFRDALAPVITIEQLLPMIPEQVESEGKGETKTPKPISVWGRFCDGELDENTTNQTLDLEPEDHAVDMEYKGSVTVDEDAGLVFLGDFMRIKWEMNAAQTAPLNAQTRIFPELLARFSVNLKHPDTYAEQRYGKHFDVDPASTASPAYFLREDIQPVYFRQKIGNLMIWRYNLAEVQQQINFYANQVMQDYIVFPSETATHAGLLPWELDGAISQVDFSIDASGVCTTTVSRNHEHSAVAPTYEEARRSQKVSESIRERQIRDRSPDAAKGLARANRRVQKRKTIGGR